MSDDETRREDARIEERIEQALRNGTMGRCCWCGDPTAFIKSFYGEDGEYGRWMCSLCQKDDVD